MPVFPANNSDPPMAPAQTRWLKRVLIPFWVIRVLAMALYEVTYILQLVIVAQNTSGRGRDRGGYIGSVVVIILFIGLCLLFDLLSMIWLCRHSLRPKTFLIFQVIETTIWIVLVVLSLVGLAGSRYRRPSPLAYILQIILLLSFLALLLYASIIYHRARKASTSGIYTQASTNPEYNSAPNATYYNPTTPHSTQNPFTSPSDPSLHNLSAQPSIEIGQTRMLPARDSERAALAPEVVLGDANTNRTSTIAPPKWGVAELPTHNNR